MEEGSLWPKSSSSSEPQASICKREVIVPVGVPVVRGVKGAVARRLMAGYILTVTLPPSVQVVEGLTFLRLYLEEGSRLEEGRRAGFQANRMGVLIRKESRLGM